MVFTWQELIDRARTYLDDDHNEDRGFMTPARWMTIANVEYAQLYRRWIRSGLIAPMPQDRALVEAAAPTVDVPLEGVLAIIGVAEVTGNDDGSDLQYRVLKQLQPDYGRMPFRSNIVDTALGWEAYGTGDTITVKIYPPDPNLTYVVRYIVRPDYETDPDEEIDLPYGTDERLVLGIARRAHLKDSTASSLLNGLIAEADAEMNFTAFQRGGGQKIVPVHSTPRNVMSSDPITWRWF